VDQALRACVEHPAASPIFLRLSRGPEYIFNDTQAPFELGEARKLRDGNDLCIIANGAMAFEAVLAADVLADEGFGVSVLNMHTVKPIDREAILDAAARVRAMLVIEEHNVFGGLGSAVLEVLQDGHDFPVRVIGIEDAYPPIGPTHELRAALGLSAENLVAQARNLFGGKRTQVRADAASK
jgi:transketolase